MILITQPSFPEIRTKSGAFMGSLDPAVCLIGHLNLGWSFSKTQGSLVRSRTTFSGIAGVFVGVIAGLSEGGNAGAFVGTIAGAIEGGNTGDFVGGKSGVFVGGNTGAFVGSSTGAIVGDPDSVSTVEGEKQAFIFSSVSSDLK